MSVSYNLSKVEDGSIFLDEIKNILVGPGPEFNSWIESEFSTYGIISGWILMGKISKMQQK